MREHALFHADQVHDRELEPLRGVHRHQRDAVVAAVVAVDVGDERHLVEEQLERAALVTGRVRIGAPEVFGRGEQLAQVLDPALRLERAVALERVEVAGAVERVRDRARGRGVARVVSELFDQREERADPRRRARAVLALREAVQPLEQRRAVLLGELLGALETRLADPARAAC